MSKIKLTVPDTICTGKMISFVAPCSCAEVTCLIINNVNYAIVDASGEDVIPVGNVWAEGAIVTVVLNVEQAKAYIQNPNHFAKRSILAEATIDANSWVNSTAPYIQSIQLPSVKADSVVEISLPPNATASHVKEYQALNLQDGGQTDGYITIRAFGTKNKSSIPINIVIHDCATAGYLNAVLTGGTLTLL